MNRIIFCVLLMVFVAHYAFSEGLEINGFIFPEQLLIIDESAFEGTFTDFIKLSDSVELIGDRAFSSIYTLKAVYVPSSVKSIGDNAFDSNTVIIGIKDSYAYKWSKGNTRHFTVYPTFNDTNKNSFVIHYNSIGTRLVALNRVSNLQTDNYKSSKGLTIGELKLIKTTWNTDFRIDGRAPPSHVLVA